MAGAADIDSAEVLKDLRRALLALGEEADRVLTEAQSDVGRVDDWLRTQRVPEVKRQRHKAEERYGEARIRYLNAKSQMGKIGRPSFEDEERDFRRAKAALDHLEELYATVRKAAAELPRLVEQPAGKARQCRFRIEELITRAVARIDSMIEGVESYQQGGGA